MARTDGPGRGMLRAGWAGLVAAAAVVVVLGATEPAAAGRAAPKGKPIKTPTPTAAAAAPTATATPVLTATPTAVPATATPSPTASVVATPDPCLGVPAYPERVAANAMANRAAYSTALSAHDRALYRPGGDDLMPTYDRIVPSEQACHGTTEQILEWVAVLTGLDQVFGDRDIVKAVAWKESTWVQAGKGDLQSDTRCAFLELTDPATGCFGPSTYASPDYQSYGITQVKRIYWPNHRASRDSTPFNAQLWAAFWRMNYDGQGWQKANTGCAWCAVGMWFSSSSNTEGSAYVLAVKDFLARKPWRG